MSRSSGCSGSFHFLMLAGSGSCSDRLEPAENARKTPHTGWSRSREPSFPHPMSSPFQGGARHAAPSSGLSASRIPVTRQARHLVLRGARGARKTLRATRRRLMGCICYALETAGALFFGPPVQRQSCHTIRSVISSVSPPGARAMGQPSVAWSTAARRGC